MKSGVSTRNHITINKKRYMVFKSSKSGRFYINYNTKDNNKRVRRYLTVNQLGGFVESMINALYKDLNKFVVEKQPIVNGVMSMVTDMDNLENIPDIHYVKFFDVDQLYNDVFHHSEAHKKLIMAYRIEVVDGVNSLEIEFSGNWTFFDEDTPMNTNLFGQ